MIINELLAKNNMTPYRLSRISGIAHTTLNDIISGKTKLEKCSVGTAYKLAKALQVSIEYLIEPFDETSLESRQNFETFKSNVKHRVKDIGDIDFIIETIESDIIRRYYKAGWYPEALYLLAMVDYLSKCNKIPICRDFNDIRSVKLKTAVYPSDVIVRAIAENSDLVKEEAIRNSIPEFMRFNIIENEVRNVI